MGTTDVTAQRMQFRAPGALQRFDPDLRSLVSSTLEVIVQADVTVSSCIELTPVTGVVVVDAFPMCTRTSTPVWEPRLRGHALVAHHNAAILTRMEPNYRARLANRSAE